MALLALATAARAGLVCIVGVQSVDTRALCTSIVPGPVGAWQGAVGLGGAWWGLRGRGARCHVAADESPNNALPPTRFGSLHLQTNLDIPSSLDQFLSNCATRISIALMHHYYPFRVSTLEVTTTSLVGK